jgi:integrase
MKGAEPHTVPLCPMALAVIEAARPFGDGTRAVFRSSYKPPEEAIAITRHAITRAVNRHWDEMGIEEAFTPHDLRRTVRTRLAELGVDDIHAERLLGHKLQGMLRIYNQHPYIDEKRAALLKWEARLLEIAGGAEIRKSNVIQLRRKA